MGFVIFFFNDLNISYASLTLELKIKEIYGPGSISISRGNDCLLQNFVGSIETPGVDSGAKKNKS